MGYLNLTFSIKHTFPSMQFNLTILKSHSKAIIAVVLYALVWSRIAWLNSQIYTHHRAGDRLAYGEGIAYSCIFASLIGIILIAIAIFKAFRNKKDIVFYLVLIILFLLPMVWITL